MGSRCMSKFAARKAGDISSNISSSSSVRSTERLIQSARTLSSPAMWITRRSYCCRYNSHRCTRPCSALWRNSKLLQSVKTITGSPEPLAHSSSSSSPQLSACGCRTQAELYKTLKTDLKNLLKSNKNPTERGLQVSFSWFLRLLFGPDKAQHFLKIGNYEADIKFGHHWKENCSLVEVKTLFPDQLDSDGLRKALFQAALY
eukprot:Polyplicarium_translucidae@DN4636_c0_g1_i1.p1